MSTYNCCNPQRRDILRDHPTLNGIDYLEVLDDESIVDADRQRTLFVHFVKPLASVFSPDQVKITGGDRIKTVNVTSTWAGDTAEIMNVQVDHPGDFSTYTLHIVQTADSDLPPAGIDPILASIDFSFKVQCDTDFDCAAPTPPAPDVRTEPQIDYLAKDYASFRRLILDRMSTLMPTWADRNPADVGMALVELLAYLGDQLSYRQDAVASEAYLATARQRISVRRHARLVDYHMHDGANARVWVQVKVASDAVRGAGEPSPLPQGTKLLTHVDGQAPRIPLSAMTYQRTVTLGAEVFETLHDMDALYTAHDQMEFYTWGDEECCVVAGATTATLRGPFPNLKAGMVLIFVEALGPNTGAPEDADPAHRHAVRLTDVKPVEDQLGGWFESGEDPAAPPLQLTQITWGAQDALPYPLCISTKNAQNVSVALGNIVLADHGGTIDAPEYLGVVAEPELFTVTPSGDGCADDQRQGIPARFRPRLAWQPLTQQATVLLMRTIDGVEQEVTRPFDDQAAAAAVFQIDQSSLLPAIIVAETATSDPITACTDVTWQPQRDLLNSDRFSREFVVETRDDGIGVLRFGDGQSGKRPEAGQCFWACYRVGNGARGNVGAGAIQHILSDDANFLGVINPLPASGGLEPESLEEVRQRAPVAFRTQERAVTADDYAAIAERHPEVQRAEASFRWTGSWRTVYVTIDRRGGLDLDPAFKDDLVKFIEQYRMAGYDVEVDSPRFVALDVEMTACAKPDYFRTSVYNALLEVFSNRVLPDGRLGVFHPDNFTFGQTIYLSKLYAAALAVEGVDTVEFTAFHPVGDTASTALADEKLVLNRLQIARLDNDPNFPDRGVLRVDVKGGK